MTVEHKPDSGFVSLASLKGKAARSADEILTEIRQIYFKTTKQTILNDLAQAIELLKQLPDEETRDKAHVYMEGIAQMRNVWLRQPGKKGKGKREKEKEKRKKETR
jgi:hypothetical protein